MPGFGRILVARIDDSRGAVDVAACKRFRGDPTQFPHSSGQHFYAYFAVRIDVCREENRVVARCAGVNRFAIPSCLIITKAAHGVALATR